MAATNQLLYPNCQSTFILSFNRFFPDPFLIKSKILIPETSTNLEWIRQRSHEAYAKNYSMIFVHDEPLAGRNMKRDVLHHDLQAAGCVYQVIDLFWGRL